MSTLLAPHKIGDSITWNIDYKQSDNITPVNLTGYTIDVDAINRFDKSVLFNITSTGTDNNSYLIVNEVAGTFSVIVKDTSLFKAGTYEVDIEFTDSEGFKKSSKSFILSVVERL